MHLFVVVIAHGFWSTVYKGSYYRVYSSIKHELFTFNIYLFINMKYMNPIEELLEEHGWSSICLIHNDPHICPLVHRLPSFALVAPWAQAPGSRPSRSDRGTWRRQWQVVSGRGFPTAKIFAKIFEEFLKDFGIFWILLVCDMNEMYEMYERLWTICIAAAIHLVPRQLTASSGD